MRGVAAASVLLCAQGAHAAATYFDRPDYDATKRLASYLASKDCAGAVKALNEGVKARQRDVLLSAGTMYETGLCVKQSWERAVEFYQLADVAGNRDAIPRLVSAYAVEGRDGAVALWWAAHRPGAMPAACIPQADPEKDEEGFEKALAAMPPALFKACVCIAGVYSSIVAEAEFPNSARRYNVYGEVGMEFSPAAGTIGWRHISRDRATGVGVHDAARLKEDDHLNVKDSLLTYMRQTGERALARYKKPDGIDPALKVTTAFSFVYD